MAKLPILGLFNDANAAADAGDGLKAAGVSENDFDFLTDAPYPEGAFGERAEKHRLYIFPFVGALLGLTSGLLLTTMTQVAYPMVTGGKPIISLPPMAVISYEGTMLGAILFTVLGIIFESRLPNLKKGLYDARITEGYIGVLVNAEENQHDRVANVLNRAGAVDVKRQS
ncbi:MAG TPA: quinol:electron acceptor oxidoreductase subunit ActD [Dehalococcoidia bacterium]|nr:quinol:electron acceptor oxidoreductase subunit ActD [Dehalococcoidia bacterium]